MLIWHRLGKLGVPQRLQQEVKNFVSIVFICTQLTTDQRRDFFSPKSKVGKALHFTLQI